MSKKPLFSIVIPTRNRAHLLSFALRSALNQNFVDYEIIVAANNCDDNTKAIVSGFTNEKIKYYETNTTLSMPDNWEFAWSKATGEYITFLPDDDAIVPSALSQVADIVLADKPHIISWEDAIYYYPNWHDERLRNTLLLFNFGDVVVENISTQTYLDQLSTFSFAWSSPLPKLLNNFAHKNTFNNWIEKTGKLFFPVAPDYSFAWISSHICEYVKVIHRPFTVRGVSDFSIGSNAGLGDATKTFINEFGDFNFFDVTQLDIPVSYNHLAATFLRANAALKNVGITPQQINLDVFFIKVAEQLVQGKDLIPNWTDYCAVLLENAKSRSPFLHDKIQAVISETTALSDAPESLRAMHSRTAKMASAYDGHMQNMMKLHDDDSECASCILALKKDVLAEGNWSYLYVFGEEINANNPYDISINIDKYYDLLTRCGKKKRKLD